MSVCALCVCVCVHTYVLCVDVMQVIGKVSKKFPHADRTTILALIHQLKLSKCEPPVSAEQNIAWIFECWRRLYRECDWTEVVEALVLVPKLGYLVSDLLSPCKCLNVSILPCYRYTRCISDDILNS